MQPSDIRPETPVEDLVAEYPEVAGHLLEKYGLRVICCGEPVWATLGEVARTRGLEPDQVTDGLRTYLAARFAGG